VFEEKIRADHGQKRKRSKTPLKEMKIKEKTKFAYVVLDAIPMHLPVA
jgi:hypothetical protein